MSASEPSARPIWRPPTPLPGPLSSPRLEIRRYREADAPHLFEAVASSRRELLPWLPWAETDHRTQEQSAETIRHFRAEYRRTPAGEGIYPLGMFDRVDGRLLGGTGFGGFDPQAASASIGYWTRADARRQGLCVEAARALITDAFTRWGLRRITLTCSRENRGSRAVVERLALRQEGIRKSATWSGDEYGWTDELDFGVAIDEWNSAKGTGPGGTSWP